MCVIRTISSSIFSKVKRKILDLTYGNVEPKHNTKTNNKKYGKEIWVVCPFALMYSLILKSPLKLKCAFSRFSASKFFQNWTILQNSHYFNFQLNSIIFQSAMFSIAFRHFVVQPLHQFVVVAIINHLSIDCVISSMQCHILKEKHICYFLLLCP